MNKIKRYKTIIIGAGPAGLTAGRNLKENFLILDKKKDIGKPIQCIGMSKESLERQNIDESEDYLKSKIYKVERIMPNNTKVGKRKKDYIGYVVERNSFEKHLAKKINPHIENDFEVADIKKRGKYWRIKNAEGNAYESEYLIGADGVDSITRKIIFSGSEKYIFKDFGVEYSVEFSKEIDQSCVKFYLDNNAYQRGYGWIFPKSSLSANIGVGGRNKNLDFKNLVLEIIKKNYEEFEIKSKVNCSTGSINKFFPLFRDNVFLVGDAAGLNDPIFSAGTNQAMISGKLAAECIIKNKPEKYTSGIKSSPFMNRRIRRSADIFHDFDNELLNEIGIIFEKKSFSDNNKFLVIFELIKKKKTRKNIFKLFYFLRTWKKFKKWLW